MPSFEIQAPDGAVYQVDGENEQGALAALQSHLAEQSQFSARAAGMDQTDLSIARSKNDAFGEYLRQEALKYRDGETPEQRDRRLYGGPMQGPSKTESAARGAADVLSWGFGDEMAAGLEAMTGGRGYAEALQRQRDSADVAYKDNPWSYRGGQVAGAAVSAIPSLMAGGGPAAGGLGGQVLRGAGTGAVSGGAYGFGSGEGGAKNRLSSAADSAAWGGLLGGAAPIVAKGVGSVVGKMTTPKAAIPETAAIKQASQNAFREVDSMGVVLSPQAYDDLARQVENAAGSAGLFPKNHPQITAALEEFNKYRGSPVPLSTISDLRQALQSAYSMDNPSQNRIMAEAVSALDDAVDNINPSQVSASSGSAADAASKLKSARADWSTFKKAELMDRVMSNAENTVGANYTQAGFQTAVRQQLRAIAKDDFKHARFFTPEERKMILDVVRGGKGENLMRWLGQFSSLTTGGLTRTAASGYIGSMIGGPAVGATLAGTLGAAGTAARPISTAMGSAALKALNAAVRNGGKAVAKSQYAGPARKVASILLGSQAPLLGEALGSRIPVLSPLLGLPASPSTRR